MQQPNAVVAHLIVGARAEPYLPAVLESIAGVCTHAVVNDNSGCIPGPNDEFLQRSRLAGDGRLTVVHSTFSGFSDARNACIDATPAQFRGGWSLFVDADEVHAEELVSMHALLHTLPADVDAVEGYSRHFVGSFSWWFSIERRLCFFRDRPDRRWHGRVHERLEPVGRRVVFPCVWFHYGHVVTPRMEWEKSRLYSSLGQPGFAPTDEALRSVSAELAWGRMRPYVNEYKGAHPPAMRDAVEQLTREWGATFTDVDALYSRCTSLRRLRRTLRKWNFQRLLAFRDVEARARWGWAWPINQFERRITSQNGEDGIIAEVFRRIGTTNRYFVEFGVDEGDVCNSAHLAHTGWSGLMIEGDANNYASLANRYAAHTNVRLAHAFVTAENIVSVFKRHGVPGEFDLLSIDIDGNDYWLWRALREYRPRFVIIEYNAHYPPPRRWVMQYRAEHQWDKTTYYGASLESLNALAQELGYALIGTDRTGVNAFFVRNDQLRKCRFPALEPRLAYHAPAFYGIHSKIGHVPAEGPFVEV